MTRDLHKLARENNIAPEYDDARGETVRISDEILADLLSAVGVSIDAADSRPQSQPSKMPPVLVVTLTKGAAAVPVPQIGPGADVTWRLQLEGGQTREGRSRVTTEGRLSIDGVPHGYHRLSLPDVDAETVLIVTPGACWLPEGLFDDERWWGISLQLYLLRSQTNFGIGDFGDLAHFASLAGRQGCDVVGVNPLHQMFLDAPEQASPYSPASRYFLNILYINLEDLPQWPSDRVQKIVTSDAFLTDLERCRSTALVDYSEVTRLKVSVLRAAFAEFQSAATPAQRAELDAFIAVAGPRLQSAALFQVLRSSLGSDTSRWTKQYRDMTSEDVARFAEQHRGEIDFLNFTQWVADTQLAKAQQACIDSGMQIGLYRDLAVGCDRSGAETWSDPHSFLSGVSVGAPPDILNPAGQNWGLPPFNPVALREQAYQPFRDLVRANMHHAGGLRIDHVMGLKRLYCIPDGRQATEGAYIEFPLEDMLGIIALESHRSRCIVVGEDLGTVPPGFREQLSAANILSYRVVMFEQQNGAFVAPGAYPAKSVSVAGSHDMATLPGWFAGSDIDLKEQLELYPSAEEVESQRKERDRERDSLHRTLSGNENRLDADRFTLDVHRFLGETRSMLAMAQLDDLLLEAEPVNVPGTVDHPNWRRKYSASLQTLDEQHPAWKILSELSLQRNRTKRSGSKP